MWLTVSLVVLLVIADVILLWWFPGIKKPAKHSASEPLVTILIALRNEQENLSRLIRGLKSLDYPKHKLQIIFGNDRSTDGTEQELARLINDSPNMNQVLISQDLPGMVGKANVLAQLMPLVKSEFIFITDADVLVPPSWIRALLGGLTSHTAVVGGCSVVRQNGLFNSLQKIDWLLAQGMLWVSGNFISTQAVSGTNMMITRSACRSIGGYEQIPYALTEDIGFLIAARQEGYSAVNVWDPSALAEVLPQSNLQKLIMQRSRWIYGAMKLPWWLVTWLLLRSLILPLILLICWWDINLAVTLLITHIMLQFVFISRVAWSWGLRVSLVAGICFDFYYGFVTLVALIHYLSGLKIPWKGRYFR